MAGKGIMHEYRSFGFKDDGLTIADAIKTVHCKKHAIIKHIANKVVIFEVNLKSILCFQNFISR